MKVVAREDADEATIYLYDAIDPWWGIAAQDFVKELNALTASTIHIRINSPGGDVFEARAIVTAMRQHGSKIVTHIDGLAASAASYVALAGKEVEISDGAFMMIHKAWSIVLGNEDDFISMAGLLSKIDDSIAAEYAVRTGKSKDELLTMMRDETWLTAQEAKDQGFVDRIAAAVDGGSNNLWDLTAYGKAPKALTEPPAAADYSREDMERRLAFYQKLA